MKITRRESSKSILLEHPLSQSEPQFSQFSQFTETTEQSEGKLDSALSVRLLDLFGFIHFCCIFENL